MKTLRNIAIYTTCAALILAMSLAEFFRVEDVPKSDQ